MRDKVVITSLLQGINRKKSWESVYHWVRTRSSCSVLAKLSMSQDNPIPVRACWLVWKAEMKSQGRQGCK